MIQKIDKYRFKNMSQEEINEKFLEYCHEGNYDMLEYLLIYSHLKADISYAKYDGVYVSIRRQYNDIFKFFVENKNLEKQISLNIHNGHLLFVACQVGNYSIIDYLLNNSKKLHLNQNNDDIFKYLIGSLTQNKTILQKLIFEYDLSYTDTIQNIVNEKNYNLEIKAMVKDWFEKRELTKSLSHYLKTDLNKQKNTNKI